jgi:S1-C subfamily serine protease
MLETYKPTVVEIAASGADGESTGTGFAWENGQQIITNAHVVNGAASIKVTDPVKPGTQYSAVVIGLSACDDVSVLKVERASFKPAKIGDSKKVSVGTHVVAVGFPGTVATSASGSSLVVTEGTASRMSASFPDSGQRDLIQHTAPINPGNSGGPLLNTKGEVIGINSYSVRGAQAENYAIAINEALFVATKLKAGKNLDDIGISVVTNSKDLASENNLPYTDGLAVMSVRAGGPAAAATPYALHDGYTVGFIDGKFIGSVGAYCDVLRSHKSGDTIGIRFGAFGQNGRATQYDTTVTLR